MIRKRVDKSFREATLLAGLTHVEMTVCSFIFFVAEMVMKDLDSNLKILTRLFLLAPIFISYFLMKKFGRKMLFRDVVSYVFFRRKVIVRKVE